LHSCAGKLQPRALTTGYIVQKQKIVSQVTSVLGNLVGTMGINSYRIVAVELPLNTIRDVSSVLIRDRHKSQSQMQKDVLRQVSIPNASRAMMDQLCENLFSKISSREKGSPQFIFVFSVTDSKFDMIHLPSS